MTLNEILRTAIEPAFSLLPAGMASDKARVMLLAIGLQESRFQHRRQIKGPARGFWQFERGTRASRGGVWGVYLHAASRGHLANLCTSRGVKFEPNAIYQQLEHDDILAAGVARLMLWTDPKALPAIGSTTAAWELYKRVWNPGRPHPETWANLYDDAVGEIRRAAA